MLAKLLPTRRQNAMLFSRCADVLLILNAHASEKHPSFCIKLHGAEAYLKKKKRSRISLLALLGLGQPIEMKAEHKSQKCEPSLKEEVNSALFFFFLPAK